MGKRAPQRWDLRDMRIDCLPVSTMDNNVYILTPRRKSEQLLIDATDDTPAILGALAEAHAAVHGGHSHTGRARLRREFELTTIVTTHSHWDHVRALPSLIDCTGAAVAAGRDDAEQLPVPVDRPLGDGDTIHCGGTELEVISLRGHTPGSIALLYIDPTGPAHLFSGDSLFPGGLGNTEGNYDRFTQLLGDVETKIFARLADDTVIHPGHGLSTTVGAERPHVPQWRERGW